MLVARFVTADAIVVTGVAAEFTLFAIDDVISLLIVASVVACCILTGTAVGVVGVVGMFACAAAAAKMDVPPGTRVGTTLLIVSPRGSCAMGFRLLLPCRVITERKYEYTQIAALNFFTQAPEN